VKTTILGLGNELLGDEGIGVHALRCLEKEDLSSDTVLVDVGTAILDALPLLEQAERIIIIDAMKGAGVPGTIYTIPLADCSGNGCIASMHGFDIFRTMALVERTDTPPVTVFGVEPELLDWSMELSEKVAASLPFLIHEVKKVL